MHDERRRKKEERRPSFAASFGWVESEGVEEDAFVFVVEGGME